MSQEPDPAQLLGLTADEELLADDGDSLPESMGRPPMIPMTRSGAAIVGVGATLTGVTLFGGIALTLLGAIDGVSSGFGALALIAVVLGVIMISTHWGWVHVAEFSANAIHSRRNSEIEQERFTWLRTLEPYTRYEVSTEAETDGSLTLATVRHRPVPTNPGHFTFVRELVDPERHPDEEPAAQIAERAEHLRREAALMTERERARFQAAADVQQRALLGQANEEEHLQARRATSEALAQQINTNLRDPPVTE
ncbi:MAG TPA: hypothetical protein VGF70_03170 [Solirubrobacteraceae bacterium]|jgi:hypothetical protein